jgi:hypothetical protein
MRRPIAVKLKLGIIPAFSRSRCPPRSLYWLLTLTRRRMAARVRTCVLLSVATVTHRPSEPCLDCFGYFSLCTPVIARCLVTRDSDFSSSTLLSVSEEHV